MSDTPMIYAAICGVMEDVGSVGKSDYNKQQGFKYRSIDSVMNALNPVMIKHKIFCVPEVLEQTREERTTARGVNLIYSVCRMRYRFYTTDGSFVDAIVVGEGMDSGDKATNKAMAVAFKYACFQTFCIPTENLMDDPDSETPPTSTKADLDKDGSRNPQQDEVKEDPRLKPVYAELRRIGCSVNAIYNRYKIDDMSEMTNLMIKDFMSKVKDVPDKEIA